MIVSHLKRALVTSKSSRQNGQVLSPPPEGCTAHGEVVESGAEHIGDVPRRFL